MRKLSRSHRVVMTLTFDKPCTVQHATREARDCIHGQFHPTQYRPEDPEAFKVRGIKPFGHRPKTGGGRRG